MHLRIAFFLASFICSCGGDEPAPQPTPPSPATTEAAPALKPWREAVTDADMLKYGERVFMSKGSNTCNDCHGKDGQKGRLEQAANLTKPENWKVAKALGGDQAKIDKALAYLISNGGKKFNQSFAKDNPDLGWDWSKTDAKSYDIQMFGVTQSSTMSQLKKIRKDLKKSGVELKKEDLVEFGTKAVLTHLRSLTATPAGK